MTWFIFIYGRFCVTGDRRDRGDKGRSEGVIERHGQSATVKCQVPYSVVKLLGVFVVFGVLL